jgi:hypothetical protein
LINDFLFAIQEHGMQRVYVTHVITLDILWLFLIWEHLRRYRIRFSDHLAVVGLVLIFSVVITAPMDPEKLGVTYISGPWFFLGLQELLRYLSPLIAGCIVPVTLILALLLTQKRYRIFTAAVYFIMLWMLGYVVLTVMALSH